VTQGPAADDKEFADLSEVGQPNEDYSYGDSKEDLRSGLFKIGRRKRRKQYSLSSPVVVVTAVIGIVAAGLLVYKFFIATPEVKAPVAVIPPKTVQQPELPVVPPLEEQKQGPPAPEAKPVEVKEVPKEAPAQKTATAPVQKTAPAPAPASVAATKAPEPATAAKPNAKKVYSVQLGAFKGESGAEALVKTYKGKGYEAFTHKGTTKDNASVYRVLIGKFENRKEASTFAAQIETKEKIKTIIFSEGAK
jgi:cell division septation protein DedD